ncbi:MAG: hypothetical protein AAFO07_17820 [Bacteroidota bacterium]
MNVFLRYIFLCLFVLIGHLANAQMSEGGTPVSFNNKYSKDFSKQSLETTQVPVLDLKKIREQDEVRPWANRFAAPIQVDFGLANAGQWTELANGDRIWQLKLQSKNAIALVLLYDQFYLPKGSRFYVYTPDKKQVLGAYTHRNNKESKKFLTGLIQGDQVILEYYEPAYARGQGIIHLFRVDHAYKQESIRKSDYEFQVHNGNSSGFDSSWDCHENIACQTDPSVLEKEKGICRIMVVVEEGTGFCTGNLMNNTSVNGIPYVLTAFHCQDGFTPQYDFWKFDFGYQSGICDNPISEPIANSIIGSEYLAGRQESDFILLELTTPIPDEYDVFYLGWEKEEGGPDSTYYIHHPLGDIKKFANIDKRSEVFNFPIDWDNGVTTPPNNHLRVVYETGFFQPGSSGAALINNAGRVIGQLHGGRSDCDGSTGYFGRLVQSWDGDDSPETQLKTWLDPLNTGAAFLDGTSNPGKGELSISGFVLTDQGRPIVNAEITLQGPKVLVAQTDENGFYEFMNLKSDERYGLSILKEENPRNGVSINDMIALQNHILALNPITDIYELISADVDRSGSVSTIDRIKIQKVIMGLDPNFQDAPNWQFIPDEYVFSNTEDPLKEELPTIFYIEDFTQDFINFNFIGIKTGDINRTADPSN